MLWWPHPTTAHRTPLTIIPVHSRDHKKPPFWYTTRFAIPGTQSFSLHHMQAICKRGSSHHRTALDAKICSIHTAMTANSGPGSKLCYEWVSYLELTATCSPSLSLFVSTFESRFQIYMFMLLSTKYSTYLFRQRLCSRLTALCRFMNFVLLLLLLLLLWCVFS